MGYQFQLRTDTTASWQSVNPILAYGEPAVEVCTNGLKKLKIGDGTTPWNSLDYKTPSEDITDTNIASWNNKADQADLEALEDIVTDHLANHPSGGGGGSAVTDSAINGNILVDGNEIQVYQHPQHIIGDITGLTTELNKKIAEQSTTGTFSSPGYWFRIAETNLNIDRSNAIMSMNWVSNGKHGSSVVIPSVIYCIGAGITALDWTEIPESSCITAMRIVYPVGAFTGLKAYLEVFCTDTLYAFSVKMLNSTGWNLLTPANGVYSVGSIPTDYTSKTLSGIKNGINTTGVIDGVDLSDFKADYDAFKNKLFGSFKLTANQTTVALNNRVELVKEAGNLVCSSDNVANTGQQKGIITLPGGKKYFYIFSGRARFPGNPAFSSSPSGYYACLQMYNRATSAYFGIGTVIWNYFMVNDSNFPVAWGIVDVPSTIDVDLRIQETNGLTYLQGNFTGLTIMEL